VIHLDSSFSMRSAKFPEIGTPDIRRKIAEELKSAREFHEISLEEVRAITKININYLESLESGFWRFLPSVYIKLFIRAFAEAVGVQSDEFSNRIDEVFSAGENDIYLGEPIDSFNNNNFETSTRSSASPFYHWAERNRAIILYGSIIIVALIIVISFLAKKPSNSVPYESETILESKREIDSVSVNPLATLETIPLISMTIDSSVIEMPPEFKFSLVTSGTCYVKIQHADSVLYERTLWPGNQFVRRYPEPIRLIVGNAPAVKLYANDKPLPEFPEGRNVRVINIGADGIIQ